jgi:Predicted AAA-ATPase/PD-(D/E)XK nuclease superfamily
MIKIPYGISDFKSLIEEGYFYQDRTHFIEELEKWDSKFPVFLRPRRFGKSLFVSMLHHYYGLEYKAIFQSLFGNLYIGKQPTNRVNSYLVLSFEFSRIDTSSYESTYEGFLVNVIEGARNFLFSYPQFYTEEDISTVLNQSSPEAMIKTLFGITKSRKVPYKIYLLVDEYDYFANELLSFDLVRFKDNVSQNGFVRKFYESLKTAARDGIIDRIFITGVAPITLDSLTSGFNISSNISTNPIFHDMVGFTHKEVGAILKEFGILEDKIPLIMSDLTEWYNGYRFAEDSTQALFNPDMVLYFLLHYGINQTYPKVMLDTNVISDYRKIRNIFKIGNDEISRFQLLDDLVKRGYVDFSLTQLYNLEAEFTDNDFLSLLYYMGMLSFKELSMIGWCFEIPNYVIKKLYFEYFASIFLAKTSFEKSKRPIMEAITHLVGEANPEAFFKIVEQVLAENHSNRDEMTYGEKHLQTLMIGLLCPYESYFIHSEYESRRGYPDIFLEKKPNTIVKYEIVIELKYLKKKEENKLPQVITEAQAQLDEYMRSERFSRPDVRGFYVVYLGGEVYQWAEWGKY